MCLKTVLFVKTDLAPWAWVDLLKLARQFDCRITFRKGELVVDAKKLLEIISLSRANGKRIEINIDGKDEKEAMDALKQYSEKMFFRKVVVGNDDKVLESKGF